MSTDKNIEQFFHCLVQSTGDKIRLESIVFGRYIFLRVVFKRYVISFNCDITVTNNNDNTDGL